MAERTLNNILYLLLRHIVLLLLLQFVMSTNNDLDISHCKQEWVRVSATSKYSFRVDCANLGFQKVPVGIPQLTAELLLNGNSIPSLDDQALAGLTSLHVLDLSGNDIETLNKSAFKDTKLERLDLSRNKIRCDTRIWWLVDYSKTLTNFSGMCLSPRPLRTRLITSLQEEDLAVDCLSVKELRNATVDGGYNIRVFARDNSNTELCIYCHRMSSRNPKEFLTLPAGVHHNYVKMKTSKKCGYNNTDIALQEKLNMMTEMTSYFIRVRIMLTSLRIITTDTTFGSNPFLNYGQPGLCGRKICTGGIAKIDLRGTHFYIKENKKIITTKRCDAEKCKKCNVTNYIPVSMMDHRKYPYLGCTLPLGLQNGQIKNSSITASSSSPGMKPYHARLNAMKYSAWCAESMDQGEYIKFDLGMVKTISGISTQGHKTQNNWVKTYHVFYSTKMNENENEKKYKEFGKDIILVGNRDSNTVATHWFQPRFRARYILVKPLTWNGNETNGNKICMRIELYGCANDITSYIIKPQLSNKCLTIDKSRKDEEESYPLMLTGCSGPDYMFTFRTNRLMHTQTGLCVNTRSKTNELILTRKCSSSNVQFQKVRQKNGREAFLIKDKDKCARIYDNTEAFRGNMQILWKWCLKYGFSILFMSKIGVSSFAPNFANTTNRVTTDLFKQVTFKCRAHADPHVIFRWSKDSLDAAEYNSFGNGEIVERTEYSILKFPNITWDDRGVYYCNAWNSKRNTSRKYVIEVNAMQWFHRRPTHQKVIWGTTAIFHCVSRGIPRPHVKWVKYNDGSLKHSISITNHSTRYFILQNKTLVIRNVVYRDEGIYMCVSTSPKLIRNSSASLDVYVTQNFTAVPEPKHVLFGEGTKFKCVSEGKPKPEVIWKMDLNGIGGLVTIGKLFEHRYEVLSDKSLHVKAVTFADEGRFYCISRSPGLLVNLSAPLTVYVTQNYTTSPVNQKLLYGHNATFECVSIGVPTPSVSWVKMEEIEGKNYFKQLFTNHKYIITTNNTLHVMDVRYGDEGKYVCFSQSPRLMRNASAMLDVYVTQNFIKSPNNTRVLYGYNAIFDCVSVGIPKPVVTWARKIGGTYEDLTSDKKYIVGSENLTVLAAVYEDEMEYVCFSQSPRLRRNATATLDVYVSQNFDVEPQGSRVLYGNNYSLHCTSTGIPTPKMTWQFKHIASKQSQIVLNSSKLTLCENGTLALYDVTLQESGTYYCVSESPGYTTNASAKVIVFVTQNFTKEPKSQKLIKGEDAKFHCNSVGSPTPAISWKYLKTGSNNGSFDDIPRLVNGRIKLLSDNTLVIKDIENEDEGDYVCLSKSPGLLVNKTARLIVHIKPVLQLTRSSKHLHIGQSTSVSCQVSGDPLPIINWYKIKNGEKIALSHSKEKKIFRQVKKEDEGIYRCEAFNDVGVAHADYDLTVTATCLLDFIEHSSHHPNKYEYDEKEKVSFKCKAGFRLNGKSNLTCKFDGKFDHPLPSCNDINECNDTVQGSGDDQNVITEQSEDDEPEVCDEYAQCVNTMGSYKCVCEEGYIMGKNKCEFEPRGEKSVRNPSRFPTRPPSTVPPPEDKEKFLRQLNMSYQSDKVLETIYLSKLQKFSSSIIRMPYDNWKVDGINKVLTYLEVAVKLAKRHQTYATAAGEKEAILSFCGIVNNILDYELVKQWKEINEKSNGSILVMKYVEEFMLQKAKILLTMKDSKAMPMEESFSNLDVKIVPVTKEYKNKPLKIRMAQRDDEIVVDNPPENYEKIKDTAGVVIMYKKLHQLFPKPNIEELTRAKIQSRLFTLTFSQQQTSLSKPIRITFRLNKEKIIPAKRFCSYWDFKKPYGGGWSTTGCEPLNISTATEVICECTHLSNFAIIVPEKTAQKVAYLTFTLSVAVGVAACIILAFCTCMSHVCCTSYGHGDRQCIMTNITIVIILGLMVFAGGVYVSSMELITDAYSTYFCFSLIGIIQLLAVACFGWLFSESIHILFSTRPVIEKRSSNLCLFYILGWVVPVGLLAITEVLVYLDKFQLQSRCSLNVSLYLIGILVGAPSACYIIATAILYMLICVSTSKNSEILGAMKVSHARRSLLCSGFLILFHLALLGAVTLYLHFNGDAMFHHILGGVAASEGIYLIIYHMFLDRMAARSKISGGSPRSRQRNSYSTKETITYASNGNAGGGGGGGGGGGTVLNDETNPTEQTRFLIKTSSKRSSVDNAKPTPPQLRTPDDSSTVNTLEWDGHGGGDMYGDHSSPTDVELKPMLSKHLSEELPETIYEEEKDYSIENGLETFGQPNVERNGTIPRSYSSLPRKKQVTRDFDEISADGSFRPTKRPGKSSSIVSIETHTSTSSQQGLPVYFPSAPPHHEIFFEEKKPESIVSNKSEDDIDGADSRPASFGIDSDRMSNLSSELSNILYELQAFNTERHPSEAQPNIYSNDCNSNTLPHPQRNPEGVADLSKSVSTFNPSRAYAKTEVQFDNNKPPAIEHHRVRVLRGRSRADADPSDGLHGNSDSIYSSL